YVARDRVHFAQAIAIVVSGMLEWRLGVLADVDPQHAAVGGVPDVFDETVHPAAVESQAIDHCVRGGKAKPPGTRVARLRARRDCSDLDESEAQRSERVDVISVLVEPGRQPDRVREPDAHDVARACIRTGPGGANEPESVKLPQ